MEGELFLHYMQKAGWIPLARIGRSLHIPIPGESGRVVHIKEDFKGMGEGKLVSAIHRRAHPYDCGDLSNMIGESRRHKKVRVFRERCTGL